MFFKMKDSKGKKGISYISGDSLVHWLDPRTKLGILILLSIFILIDSDFLRTVLLFMSVILMASASGLIRQWIFSLRYILPFFIFIVTVDAFFYTGTPGTTFFSAGFWIFNPCLSAGSLNFAISMGIRLLAICGFSFLFIMTTSYSEFVKSLRAMKIPGMLSFSLGFALKSVTSLSRDACSIMDAQRSRGLEFDRDSVIRNRDKLFSLFVPMTVSVMKGSSDVCDAMQCRGFGSCDNTTIHNPVKLKEIDFMIFFAYCLFLIMIHLLA